MLLFPGLQRIPAHLFGRRRPFTFDAPEEEGKQSLADDARLFFMTFASGLLFMTVYLA